ncbi:MAG: hypothetical protein ACREJ3_07420 [Polyangiaceae bacterium]
MSFAPIHGWGKDTLDLLLADHLLPAKRRLDGERGDLEVLCACAGAGANRAHKRLPAMKALLDELNDFIAKVTETAERGPARPDEETRAREVDARFEMILDDGVMVNGAALWPLLDPQWKEPKKWWKNIASRTGPKGAHLDWSRTAARYFPARVLEECERDPALAAAHRCLWRHHPKTAYEWELRLQRDARSSFAIIEPDADVCRRSFLGEQPGIAREVRDAEARRARRASRRRTREEGGAAGAITDNRARRR